MTESCAEYVVHGTTRDGLSDLRTRITRIVRQSTGLHERLALPVAEEIVREIQREHGGGELYIPAPSRNDRDQAIRDAIACGMSVAECARRHGVPRATVYRVLADGQGPGL